MNAAHAAADAVPLCCGCVQVTFREPRMPVYSNVTGAPFPDAASIPALLARQLTEPVRWEGTVQARKHAHFVACRRRATHTSPRC